MVSEGRDATALLEALSSGDRKVEHHLFSVLYDELHDLAHAVMWDEKPGHLLQTTALIHEAYLRLVQAESHNWSNRKHFLAVAAKAMRRILVDNARQLRAAKRGGGRRLVSLEELGGVVPIPTSQRATFEDLEQLDVALDHLGAQPEHQRLCSVVELRYFAGLTVKETAEVLDVSPTTVKEDWAFARAWLFKEMRRGQ